MGRPAEEPFEGKSMKYVEFEIDPEESDTESR